MLRRGFYYTRRTYETFVFYKLRANYLFIVYKLSRAGRCYVSCREVGLRGLPGTSAHLQRRQRLTRGRVEPRSVHGCFYPHSSLLCGLLRRADGLPVDLVPRVRAREKDYTIE